MQPFLIKMNDHLSQQELHDLRDLAKICEHHDGETSKLYWEIISHKRELAGIGNFLCYSGNVLIGYFSFFLFEETPINAEAVAIVNPTYRRQGVFLRLLQKAIPEMIKLGCEKIIFSFPKNNKMAKECLISLGGNYLYSEYRMERLEDTLETIDHPLLSMQKANSNDIELIAKMDAFCFNSNFSIMLQRYKDTIEDVNREIWLGFTKNICVGKVHVYFDDHKTLIHNVCILPNWQRQGYGTYLLKFIINHLINRDNRDNTYQMYLEIKATNESALALYKNCHFEMTNIYEYWRIDIPKN